MANNKIAYGIAKGLGIDTSSMSPKEVWEAIAKKKGVSVDQAQKQADGADGRKSSLERLQKLSQVKKGRDNTDNDDIEVVEVDLTADIQKQFDKATPKERQDIAFNYIMENLRGKYPATDGRLISLERVGADKMSHTLNETKIRVLPKLADLIETGQFIGLIDVEHKKFVKMAYYKVAFRIEKVKYVANLNVGIRQNGDSTLYDINPFNKE